MKYPINVLNTDHISLVKFTCPLVYSDNYSIENFCLEPALNSTGIYLAKLSFQPE